MWFLTPRQMPDWSAARRYLSRVDPRLRPIIRRVGPCTLHPRRDHFALLCQSIFTQQISSAVATVLFGRFRDLFPLRRPTPQRLLALDDMTLRGVGLSRSKIIYLRDLANHFTDGRLCGSRLAKLSDERVEAELTAVRGIGRWTAEMFLIFALNRPDVFPAGDLGIRKVMIPFVGGRDDDLPAPAVCIAAAEIWRPWRTIAAWYLWRGLEG